MLSIDRGLDRVRKVLRVREIVKRSEDPTGLRNPNHVFFNRIRNSVPKEHVVRSFDEAQIKPQRVLIRACAVLDNHVSGLGLRAVVPHFVTGEGLADLREQNVLDHDVVWPVHGTETITNVIPSRVTPRDFEILDIGIGAALFHIDEPPKGRRRAVVIQDWEGIRRLRRITVVRDHLVCVVELNLSSRDVKFVAVPEEELFVRTRFKERDSPGQAHSLGTVRSTGRP